MVIENLGLQTSALTWYLALGLLVSWAFSLPLLVRVRGGWQAVLMSLGGLAWLGFGLGIVLRFFLLSFDAQLFGNPSTRLADRLSPVVDFALANASVYWASFVAGALATRLLPVPRLLTALAQRPEALARRSILPTTVLSCVCIVLSLRPGTPASLVTPLGLLGSMWVIPATVVWVGAFRALPTSPLTLVGALVPGLLRLVLSPYREHILTIGLVVLSAAVFAARRIRLVIMVPVAVAIVLISTVAVSTYRQVIWTGLEPDEALSNVSFAQWEDRPFEAPWSESLRRFHGFDSLLLTVDLVPDVFPFSERNVLLEGVARGLVPRLIDGTKAESDEGMRFQTTIWAYDDDPTRDEATASIAPSMPGSLYEAGGIPYVAIGGFLWAAILIAIDRLKSQLSSAVSPALHVLCAVQALAGIERDYAMAFATLMQTLVVFFGICLLTAWTHARTHPSYVGGRALAGE